MYQFRHVSDMMKADKETFTLFVKDMLAKTEAYLQFVQSFNPEVKAVQLEFYELDADFYDYEVFKWSVDFRPAEENSLLFRGYYLDDEYTLINKQKNSVEIIGTEDEIYAYIDKEEFRPLTQDEINDLFKVTTREIDKCEEWIGQMEGFKTIFQGEKPMYYSND